MGQHIIKMPDIGEGVAEAELVEWTIEVGAQVREDDVLASVMTDKATVEIPAPKDGKIIWLGAEIGDTVAVGSPIIRMEVDGDGNIQPGEAVEVVKAEKPVPEPEPKSEPKPDPKPEPVAPVVKSTSPPPAPRRAAGEKPLAAPSVRRRAMDAGIDLRRVAGSGPAGRILHEDLDTYLSSSDADVAPAASNPLKADTSVKEIKVVGLRRKIAEQMSRAKSRIPHITYVDEIDVTAVEELRERLNKERKEAQTKLTLLPFLMRAMAKAIKEQPQMSARFDDEAGVIHQSGGMHMGVAAQTDNGLVVPVVRHVEAKSLRECAAEVARLAEAARKGTATREELSGSTIT
ncbi:MAG: dihydrolipoamide acetyltransferase family protein, partial [Pseudomonadota bacterium]